jgi:hypothetical protein
VFTQINIAAAVRGAIELLETQGDSTVLRMQDSTGGTSPERRGATATLPSERLLPRLFLILLLAVLAPAGSGTAARRCRPT